MTEVEIKHKSYKFRLKPTAEQKTYFAKTFGCTRAIWNMMLYDKIAYYEETGKALTTTPAQYKDDKPWLKEVDSLALANAQVNLNRAYKDFFNQNKGFPNFKKKSHKQSYTTNNNQRYGTIAVQDGKVKLPKIGWVDIIDHRPISGKIKSATITMTTTGKYYISILCETIIPPLPQTGSSVGIDLGLENFAILSTGEKVGNQHYFEKSAKKLAKEQRKLSRIRKLAEEANRDLSECKNYQKQRRKVAKIHEKVANQRRDFLHKLSTSIIKNHDKICIETLSSKILMKNRRLAKAISDVSWSEFVRLLQYKADWYDKTVIKISRWYPSSQLCSSCGHNSGKKPLHIREWTCPECHVHHDRDINASINILNEGLRLA